MKRRSVLAPIVGGIFLVILLIVLALFVSKKTSYDKIIERLKDDGYQFEHMISEDLDIEDIIIANQEDKIMLEKAIQDDGDSITYTYLDMSLITEDHDDYDYSDYRITIKSPKKYTSSKKEKQYKSYQKWLKKYHLTEKQAVKLLDYYQKNSEPNEI